MTKQIQSGPSGQSARDPEARLERLIAVLTEHADPTRRQGRRSRAFGFYWTRKSVELARDLIRAFTTDDGVVLDPFLGSGTTILGVEEAGGARIGIGVEINEMPLENLRFTLGASSDVDLGDMAMFESALREISCLYEFSIGGVSVTVSRIIHAVDGHLVPTRFEAIWDDQQRTLRAGDDGFTALTEAYQQRVSSLPERDLGPLETNSRIAVKQGMSVADVFGPLGFEALSRLRELGGQSMLVRLIIGASLHLCRLTDAKSQSQFPYWFPRQEIHEKSAYLVLAKQFAAIERLLREQQMFGAALVEERLPDRGGATRPRHLLIRGSCTLRLPAEVPPGSVDLVLTDPPYFDQVAYSEYLKMWEHFTGFEADLDNEIVESSRVGGERTRKRYLDDIEAAFGQVRSTLAEAATVLVYFKDSKPRNLHDFISALGRAGLEYRGQAHLAKPAFTYKQNATKETTVGGDAIMVFVPSRADGFVEPVPQAPREELDAQFVEDFRAYVSENGPSSLTEALDNRLVDVLYRRGHLALISSSGHFTDLIADAFVFNPTDRRWSPR